MLNIPGAIKTLYLADSRPDIRKNFRVVFPNGELPDICNDQILSESVQLTESIMSQSTFKFGLAEAPQISFETIGVANMLGMTIECYHEIETTSLSAADITTIQAGTWDGELVLAADSDLGFGFFRIPLGSFIVDSCPRNHGAMTHRKVTAFGQSVTEDTAGNVFAFERWKDSLLYYGQTTRTIRLRNFLFANMGIDIFGSVYAETTQTLSVTNTQQLYSGYGSSAIPVYFVELIVGYSREATSYSSGGVDYDVWSYELPELEEDIVSPFDAFWAANMEGYFPSSIYDDLLDIIEGYYSAVRGAEYGYSGLRYAYESTGSLKAQYPLTRNDNGVVRYTPADGYNDGYILFPFTLTINVARNGLVIETLVLDLYANGGAPTLTFYQLEDSSDNGSTLSLTIEKTAEEPGYYYSYVDAFPYVDVANGALELSGAFGLNDRAGKYQRVELDNSSPYSMTPGDYSECWYEEFDISDIGVIIYKYEDADNGEQIISYDLGNGGESVYDLTGNYLLAEIPTTKAQAKSLIDTHFVPHIGDVEFTPVEMTAKGRPWVEPGDAVEVTMEDGEVVETYILERTLSGIVSLTDDVKSTGGTLISVEVTA